MEIAVSRVALWLLYIGAIATTAVSLVAALRGDKYRRFLSFDGLMVCILGMLACNLFEFSSRSAEGAEAWSRANYAFVAFAPVLWLLFARCDSGRGGGRTEWRLLAVLSLIPVATVCLRATNGAHRMIWSEYRPAVSAGFRYIDVDAYGPWFWVHSAYSYGLLGWGAIEFFTENVLRQRVYRVRSVLACLAVGLPAAVDILFILESPYRDCCNFSSAFLSITAALLAWLIVRYKLISVVPPSRDELYERVERGLTVINDEGIIVDMNGAAAAHFGLDSPPIGSSYAALGAIPAGACEALPGDSSRPPAFPLTIRTKSLVCEVSVRYLGSPAAKNYIVSSQRRPEATPGERSRGEGPEALSRREREILALLLTDASNKAIADGLCISENTLKTHIKHILKKLGKANRGDLQSMEP